MARPLLFASLLAALLPGGLLAQAATLTGRVATLTGDPIPGATVSIEGMPSVMALADERGGYSLSVPAARVRGQVVTAVATSVGYRPQRRELTLTAGTHNISFELETDVFQLEAVVITGVASSTPKKELAFSVDQVSEEQLELAPPANNPVQQLEGRVAGVQVVSGSATPGGGVSVRLRGTTSVEGSSQPLYIVDGVILTGGQLDLDPQDVETIEVVKGAAASSIYGSRAQNGVIQITTKRGRGVDFGQTRVTVRNEFGFNELPRTVPRARSHIYMIADSSFLDAEGTRVEPGDWLKIQTVDGADVVVRSTYEDASVDRSFNGMVFQDNPYPGAVNDHLDRFFEPGSFARTYVAVSRRLPDTNYRVSFGNVREAGVVRGAEGYTRRNVRLNLDHQISDRFGISVSGYLSRADRDDPQGPINPFAGLFLIDPQADLSERDEEGRLIVQPDPRSDVENPLYVLEETDVRVARNRLLGNLKATYTPLSWLELEGTFAYDRLDRNEERFFDKGFVTINPADFNNGRYIKANSYNDAVNGSLTAAVNRRFGDLVTRSRANVLVEREYFNSTSIQGDGLATKGVRDLDNITGAITRGSHVTDSRGVYYFLATQGVWRDRYIADLLVRRDGSSLFGPEERWHNYFRASGAYRISEEPWWPLRGPVDELKLRYSYGTAGAQPAFAAQYETFALQEGNVVKATLGNRFLKPELQTEQEAGIEAGLFGRVSAEVVYAKAVIEDQLLRVPLPGYAGYTVQWRNAGTVESNTWEATVRTALMRERDRSWNVGLVFDRTRQRITEFGLPPFRSGPQGAFEYRAGEELGAIYGHYFMRDPSELPEEWQPYREAFQVNDDGYLVPVGAGNSWQDGMSGQLWGTMVDVDGDGEEDFPWGIPIQMLTEERTNRVKIGSSTADFNLGVTSMLRWGGITASMLWDAQIGGEVYNFARQRAYRADALAAAELDQAGKPDERKKPLTYYQRLYERSSTSNEFIEDASYMKLRELSLSYQISPARLRKLLGERIGGAFYGATIGIIGRNLLTFTDYTGYDPEVGVGDATLIRWDNFGYPNYRTFTGRVELTF